MPLCRGSMGAAVCPAPGGKASAALHVPHAQATAAACDASSSMRRRLCTVQALANACMAADPAQRPTFAEAHSAVDAKLQEVQADSGAPPPQASSPFASAPAPKVALAR